MHKENPGVVCNVSTCLYNKMNNICGIEQIKVTSDPSEKHFCRTFKMK